MIDEVDGDVPCLGGAIRRARDTGEVRPRLQNVQRSRWPLAHADEMQPARAVCKSKHIRRISKPLPRAHAFFLRSRRPRPPALPLARIMHAVKVEPHMPETTHRRPRCFATSLPACDRAQKRRDLSP